MRVSSHSFQRIKRASAKRVHLINCYSVGASRVMLLDFKKRERHCHSTEALLKLGHDLISIGNSVS